MEAEIAQKLQVSIFKNTGKTSTGCISSANVYETENGLVFVKRNTRTGSEIMFNGEYEGLKALKAAGLPVPSPLALGKNYVAMDYLELNSIKTCSKELGTILGKVHLGMACDTAKIGHNTDELKFGFSTATSCGFLPMVNDWQDDWVLFYASQRMQPHIDRLMSEYGDRELSELWSQLQIKIPLLFTETEVCLFPA